MVEDVQRFKQKSLLDGLRTVEQDDDPYLFKVKVKW